MKKTNFLYVISIGLLLFLPFIRVSVAAPPSWAGIKEDDTYVFEYLWDDTAISGAWTTDNMNSLMYDNMDAAGNSWMGVIDLGNMSHTITVVGDLTADIEYGSNYQVVPFSNQMVWNTTEGGVIWSLDKSPDYTYEGIIIENETEFVLWHNGLSNWFKIDFTPSWPQNSIAVPTNFDWDEVATAANIELADNSATVTALTNGFQITVAASAWGTNTLALGLAVTFDECGLLELWDFTYGTDSLMTVEQMAGATCVAPAPPGIPGFDLPIVIGITSIISLILIKKIRKK